jgi:hypothetical protein
MKRDTTRLGLYVTAKRDGEYFRISATVVTLGHTAYERASIDKGEYVYPDITDQTIRNPRHDEPMNGLDLDDLTITSQGNQSDTERRLYAFDLRYQNLYAVDLRRAKSMTATLVTLGKRMDKQYAQYGPASTFGAYLARVATAIGADTFIFAPTQWRGFGYNDNVHMFNTVADGVSRVEWLTRRWMETGDITAETAVSA